MYRTVSFSMMEAYLSSFSRLKLFDCFLSINKQILNFISSTFLKRFNRIEEATKKSLKSSLLIPHPYRLIDLIYSQSNLTSSFIFIYVFLKSRILIKYYYNPVWIFFCFSHKSLKFFFLLKNHCQKVSSKTNILKRYIFLFLQYIIRDIQMVQILFYLSCKFELHPFSHYLHSDFDLVVMFYQDQNKFLIFIFQISSISYLFQSLQYFH